jgi:tetratricopeptide (TPR) repeat protein
VPGLPADVRGQILARAEGVPLYAVETVRMLLDRGVLVQEGAAYRPVAEITALAVPETLHALIAARLDGLSPDERRTIQDAAVLGKTFPKPALVAMTGMPEPELDGLLTGLVRKEMLAVQADPRSPEHGHYGFLQDLVRHVAYETLSRRERRLRHLAAADGLGGGDADDEVVEVVASHLLDAYAAEPDAPEAAETKRRAFDALVGAGERAASLAAAGEAKRYFEQAADLADDAAARATLVDRAGEMAWRAGKAVEARALLERAQAAYDREGDRLASARVSGRLGEIDLAEGHLQDAVARIEPALETLRESGPAAVVAPLAAQLGRMLALNGEYERAYPHLELALELAEGQNMPDTLAHALASKAVLLMTRDRLLEARFVLEGALTVALERDLHEAALRTYNNLAMVDEASDRFVQLVNRVDRALELARRVGDRGWEGFLILGGLSALVNLGRWDEALERVAHLEEVAATHVQKALSLDASPIHCERGDVETARQLLTRFADAADVEDFQVRAAYTIAEARVLRAEGRPDAALRSAERGIALGSQLGGAAMLYKRAVLEALEASLAIGDDAKARSLIAALGDERGLPPLLRAVHARFRARLAAEEDGAAAEREWARAEAEFAALEMPVHRAVALLEHGEWLAARGRAGDAEPLLAEAGETFTLLRAAPWLDRMRLVPDSTAVAS